MPLQTADYLTQIRAALAAPSSGSSDFDMNMDAETLGMRNLRAAGVLIAFMDIQGQSHVLLTKRSAALKHHPGQVAFPGGKVDPDDLGAIGAALREAEEEIALPAHAVNVLGHLGDHITVTNFRVTPVLGQITKEIEFKPEKGEVEEIFSVPLSFLLNKDNYHMQSRMFRGKNRRYFTVPYGPYYIWGATARILHGFAERMAKCA